MPIKFESGILQEFFGHPIVRIDESNAEVYVVDYNVAQLHHTFYFDVAQELVSLGCSFEDPFGADSLFEIGVPCDSISRIPDGYHPGQLALGFWYGDPTERHNCTMELLKRPDGHLKVGLLAFFQNVIQCTPKSGEILRVHVHTGRESSCITKMCFHIVIIQRSHMPRKSNVQAWALHI